MRKFIIIFLVLCVAVSVPATAHSGRTDSAGGHTNHSTGEYHYHHGYPAHDHYDMDGDGDRDCPYTYTQSDYYDFDFDAWSSGYNTGYQRGKNEQNSTVESLREQLSSANATNRERSAEIKKLTATIETLNLDIESRDIELADAMANLEDLKSQITTNEVSAKKRTFWFSISAALFMMILCIVLHNRSAKNKEFAHREEVEKTVSKFSCEIESKDKAIDRLTRAVCDASGLFSQKDLFLLLNDPADEYGIKLPDHIHLTEDGTPYTGTRTEDRRFGDLTLYVAAYGKCHHRKYLCSGAVTQVCLYDQWLPTTRCGRCHPALERSAEDVVWFTALQRLKQERKIRTVRDIVDTGE